MNEDNVPIYDEDQCLECGGKFGSADYRERIECVGGPEDGSIIHLRPPHVPFLIAEPRDTDIEDCLGYGYKFEINPPRYVFVGIVRSDADDPEIGNLYYWTVEEEEGDEGSSE